MKRRLRISPVLLVCILIISIVAISGISCGIEEYYYLPQPSDGDINRTGNYEAVINIQPISDDLYYAACYSIFYRIYPSEHYTLAYITQNYMSTISSSLASDYSYLSSVTDPTNTTSIPSSSTFENRNYFEIEFEDADVRNKLSTAGGTLRISFPAAIGGIPFVNINGEQFNLIRSSKRLITPKPDLYFRNSSELRDRANVNENENADVAVHSGSPQYTYVSMYIAVIGTNPTNFNQIISKPTHISVFRLSDFN